IQVNGGVNMSVSSKSLIGCALINAGPATWSNGVVNFSSTAYWSNAPGSTLDILYDGNVFNFLSGNPLIANAGTLRKSLGSLTSTLTVPLINSGLVEADSGILAVTLTNGTGNFTANSGGTLSVSGNAILDAASTIGGSGNFTVTGGTITNFGAF